MTFPEWAPQVLIDEHKKQVKKSSSEPEDSFEDFLTEMAQISGEEMNADEEKHFRRLVYRECVFLPANERLALLELLITDLRMKKVWDVLTKWAETDQEFSLFFQACELAILGWRGDPKQTACQQRALDREIQVTAKKLLSLLRQSGKYDSFGPRDFIEDGGIYWLLHDLRATNPDYVNVPWETACRRVRVSLSVITPKFDEMLDYVAATAEESPEEEYLVKHPNSPNAQLHYFTRSLSAYCMKRYHQPLYEVVSNTASVIFDRPSIDSDYVRKIVKR